MQVACFVLGLVALSAGKGLSGHGVVVDFHSRPDSKDPLRIEHNPFLFLNSDGIQGTLELRNATLDNHVGYKDDLHFDPVHLTIFGYVSFPKFHLITEYKANLAFKKPDGNFSIFAGQGHWDMRVDHLRISNIEARLEYCVHVRNIQLTSYNGRRTSSHIGGVITGATIDGKPAGMDELLKLNEEAQKPFIREFNRALLNQGLLLTRNIDFGANRDDPFMNGWAAWQRNYWPHKDRYVITEAIYRVADLKTVVYEIRVLPNGVVENLL